MNVSPGEADGTGAEENLQNAKPRIGFPNSLHNPNFCRQQKLMTGYELRYCQRVKAWHAFEHSGWTDTICNECCRGKNHDGDDWSTD